MKVELTKEEKRRINRPSSPRWELDVVGYRGATNELLVLECKSFLDSPGVRTAVFEGSIPSEETRYKLFFDQILREVVLARLVTQFVELGFCRANPIVRLGLAAGKIKGDPKWLHTHFKKNGWLLWDPGYIRQQLALLRDVGFENSIAAIVAKILLRGEATTSNVDEEDAT